MQIAYSFPHLRPASFNLNREALFCRTNSFQRSVLNDLLRIGKAEMPTDTAKVFQLIHRQYSIGGITTPTITVLDDDTVCGFALFQIVPAKPKESLEVGEMHTMPRKLPSFEKATDVIHHTEVALKVDPFYQANYRGIGTTALALALHLAHQFDLPFMRVIEDISVHGSLSGTSFYTSNGFISGDQANRALRQAGILPIIPHGRRDKVFYLNGSLIGAATFTIPQIAITHRIKTENK